MPSGPLTQLPEWHALRDHYRAAAGFNLRALFDADPGRFGAFSLKNCGILLDYSRHPVTAETIHLLTALAERRRLAAWIERMFTGGKINDTENRAALHTALRGAGPVMLDGRDIAADVARVLGQMRAFCEAVRGGKIKGYGGRVFSDVVNIGIGGSDLGPALAVEALAPYGCPQLRVHFVSNVDGAHLAGVLSGLDPETTLFVVASKTFTTLETLVNANSARDWLIAKAGSREAAMAHFAAVTANAGAARQFGVDDARIFEMWDWVGGRYSLWSAVGLPVALAVGMDHFDELLAGAREMDDHFRTAPPERNMPVLLGLLGIWQINFFGTAAHAVLPYDQSLRRLPDYLQQLEMESNGKRVTRDGAAVDYATAPVIFGAAGTNGQHSFHQLLHQGTRAIPADFIGCCRGHYQLGSHHEILMSNLFAQAEALMRGRTAAEAMEEMRAQGMAAQGAERLLPHRVLPGNRPSTTLLLEKLEPRTLGALIALYEHKVFVQGVVWGINSFDQFGVELGKELARDLLLPVQGMDEDGP
ncbi:MAG: glucose-6-phosphate isomerase, partial [Burkholderiales bacterium]|nr:glucose-6-phosphate isomerase [Burkholderiales bacterium]